MLQPQILAKGERERPGLLGLNRVPTNFTGFPGITDQLSVATIFRDSHIRESQAKSSPVNLKEM